ncbi:MAG: hypothetical protein QCI38_08170, partial [Candidatus Thermoplasmatota archaeon]|nr:hypothetical protein [Candidatus Thermoplasmatota archaeon]
NGLTTAGITNGTTNGRINGRINGMTNGRVNGLLAIGGRINGRGMVNGNGLTNGRGVINGRGLINGVGRVNGRGMVNGNGLINGIGRVNGRGLINGLGRTNGNGLINGLGRINGNGLINGLGMVNGRGLVNGNGLINGLGKFYKPRRRSSDLGWARSTVGLGIALVLLMVLPGLVTIMYTVPPAPGITIDGEFADWSGTPIFRDSRSDFLDPNLDLEEYGIYNDRSTVSFYAKVSGTFFGAEGEMAHALLVLIDSDGDPETGYSFNSLGVDTYFIISGYDGEARRISQYVFNNSQGQDAWSGFRSTNTRAEFSSRGSEFELKTSANGIPIYSRDGARFAMATIDTLRQGDVSDTPFGEGTPALRVESRTLAPSIVNPGDVDVPLLYMNVRATSENATLATIFFSHRGVGGLETLALYEDTDRSQTLTALDRTIPTIISYGERSITMELITPVHLLAGQEYSFSIAATINNQAQPETLVSVTPAQNPISGAVSFLKHSSSGNTYVLSPPGRIAIDGAFGDWDDISPVEDAVGDVEGGPNHNVDLAQTRLALDDQHMSFFLQV